MAFEQTARSYLTFLAVEASDVWASILTRTLNIPKPFSNTKTALHDLFYLKNFPVHIQYLTEDPAGRLHTFGQVIAHQVMHQRAVEHWRRTTITFILLLFRRPIFVSGARPGPTHGWKLRMVEEPGYPCGRVDGGTAYGSGLCVRHLTSSVVISARHNILTKARGLNCLIEYWLRTVATTIWTVRRIVEGGHVVIVGHGLCVRV